MSQSAEASTSSDVPTKEEELPESSTFTLQIVSPNSDPLSFPRLPVTTTVKQLKAKIRDALPAKPIDEHQRIIYRGRMLASETTTMMEVFGSEALAIQEPQNLHLVLRQTAPDAPAPTSSTPPIIAGPRVPPPTIPHLPPVPQLLVPQLLNRPQSTPAVPAPGMPGMQAQQPLPGFQQMQQAGALQQMQHLHNVMAQRLQRLQQETQRLHQEMGMLEARTQGRPAPTLFNSQQPHLGQNPVAHPQGLFQMPQAPHVQMQQTLQNLINQQQRERAAEGRHGAQDAGTNAPHSHPSQPPSGRASPSLHRPDHTTTYTREGIGPNGERFHITVNETTTTLPLQQPHQHHVHGGQQANPALDIQAILRNADRFMATQGAQNNMQRSASNPIPAPASSAAPGITRPGTPGTIPNPTTTTNNSPSTSIILNPHQNANVQAGATTSLHPSDPTVYILSSPSGPRALLVNNAETYYTPRQSRRHSPVGPPGQAIRAAVGLPEFRNRPAGRAARHNQRHPNDNPLEPVNAGHAHANPGAGALAAQIGPILWLVVRLVGFVWFFTSGNTSWTRWLLVSGCAFLVFLFNTGIFNGVAETVWGPVRRHLENLIPLGPAPVVPGAQPAAPAPAAPDAVAEPEGRRRRAPEPDPAQVAARLLEQRRQEDRSWLMAQFRRAEHALLLFLASLVPGVGERHIAAREAEANAVEAERQRLIQEAEAANAAENAENGEGTTAAIDNGGENGENGENQTNQDEGVAAPPPPLIEV
ncbi:hypothetical protein BDZ45DRAFT_722257 [Acephala macrosclerotiorum]|nr:hypothetical protein BDZ45DRAFT_722257 [Acephala macrosclerotiorum]